MRPTWGCAGAFAAAGVLNALGRVNDSPWLALASSACGVLPVAAAVFSPRLAHLTVERSGPTRFVTGVPAETTVTVRNTGGRASPPVRLTETTGGLAPLTVAVPALPAGGTTSVTTTRTAGPRGVYRGGTARLEATQLGLIRTVRTVRSSGTVVVHPVTVPARVSQGGSSAAGSLPRPIAGPGTEVLGLRAWRPGDGAGAVSARASARQGRPWVLERERDGGPGLVVLVNTNGTGPAWETAVSRAASVAVEAARAGLAPRLLGRAGTSRSDRNTILDWFSGLDDPAATGPAKPSATAAGAALRDAIRVAGPGGTLVYLTGPGDPALAGAANACRSARVRLEVPHAT